MWAFYFSTYKSHDCILLIFLAFAAIVSTGMWLDYFRRIDVFEKESIVYLISALITGGLMSYVCLLFYGILERAGFTENKNFFTIYFTPF